MAPSSDSLVSSQIASMDVVAAPPLKKPTKQAHKKQSKSKPQSKINKSKSKSNQAAMAYPSDALVSSQITSTDVVAMAPLKKPRISRWTTEARGTAFVDMPIQAVASDDSSRNSRRYPRRSTRMPPLEYWRNERIEYKRTSEFGESAMSIRFNFAPRSADLEDRFIPMRHGVPVIADSAVQTEFKWKSTAEVQSQLIVLPPWREKQSLAQSTFVVPKFSSGWIQVLEGTLRCAYAGKDDMATLQAGDFFHLPGSIEDILLASAVVHGTSNRTKFKITAFGRMEGTRKDQ